MFGFIFKGSIKGYFNNHNNKEVILIKKKQG